MASFINSVRNLTSDAWWFVKIGIYATALFFILNQGYYIPARLDDETIKIFLYGLFFLFLGIAGVTIHRNINNISPIFPGPLSIFEILIKGVFSTIAIIPGILLSYIVFQFLQTFTFDNLFVFLLIYLIAAAIMSAFIFIPVVLVNVRGNLLDFFRLDILFRGAGNYIVQFLSYLIQYVIILGIITAILYYFLIEMLGDHWALLYLKSLVIVLTFFSIFSYSSDLYGDGIPEMKFKEGRKRQSREEVTAQRKAEEEEKKKLKKKGQAPSRPLRKDGKTRPQNRPERPNRPNGTRPNRPTGERPNRPNGERPPHRPAKPKKPDDYEQF